MHRLGCALFLLLFSSVRADITLLGKAEIPGDAADKSGLTDVLSDGTPQNRLGSFGSGIAYTGRGNRYIAVDDRGPSDGAAEFRNRFQTFDIVVQPGKEPALSVTLVGTTLLSSGDGTALTGCARGLDPQDQLKGVRLDPEGVRVSRQGTLWVSDEYGPWIDEFSMDGRRLKHLKPPAEFMISHPSADPKEELKEPKGRQANRGLEGLAITPDGSKLFAIMQSPLLQDHGLDAAGKRSGVNNRIIELDIATGKTREFVYQMSSPHYGVNEILAINGHEFLVLERDSKGGTAAKLRGLFRIDIDGATSVSETETLPATGLPEEIKPVTRTPFLDFMDSRFGLTGASMPEKIEGLAFGPDLPDGRHVLIATVDNDLIASSPSVFWAFAIDAKELPGYQPQTFNPVPSAK